MNDDIYISVVAPVYNEEEVLPEFYRRLTAVMESVGKPYEIILVNDGSRDRSLQIIKELNAKDRRVKAVDLSRNFGHQIALTAGIDHAAGQAVIVMDSDLQNPPELIPQMVALWREGYDVVNTVRNDAAVYSPTVRLMGASFYGLMKRVSGLNLAYGQSDFRLMDRKVVQALQTMREGSRFLRGLTEWAGFQQTAIPYELEKRFAGKSKYNLLKYLSFAIDGILSFSIVPLRMAVFLGLFVAAWGFAEGVFYICKKVFFGIPVPGWTELIVTLLFLGGLILVVLGVIGEYIGRIYEEVKQRPLYFVKEHVGFHNLDEVTHCQRR